MALSGYTTAFAPGTSTAASDFHTFLSNNLANWTVNNTITFRSGTSAEYLAWTIEHANGFDILFIAGVGSSADWDAMMNFNKDYRFLNSAQTSYKDVQSSNNRPITMAFHPNGAWSTQLYTNSYVPHNKSPFWDVCRIDEGTGVGLGTQAWPLPWVRKDENGNTYDWYLIEDDTDGIFNIKYHQDGDPLGGVCEQVAGDIIDSSWPPADQSLDGTGMIRIFHDKNGGSGDPATAKKDLVVYGTGASQLNDFYVWKDTDFEQRVSLINAENHFPDANSQVITDEIPIEASGVWAGHLDSNYFREFPNDGDTYQSEIAPSASRSFVHLYDKMASLWDSGLTMG